MKQPLRGCVALLLAVALLAIGGSGAVQAQKRGGILRMYSPGSPGGPDPDPLLHLFYGCGASLNWDRYCNPEVDKLIDAQSREADPTKRKQILWEIERKLAADYVRPIIFYAPGGTCWQPSVNGVTVMVNSIFNGWRMEDIWLDK